MSDVKHTSTIDLNLNDHASDPAERAAQRIGGALKQMQAEARRSGEKVFERVLSSPQGLAGAGFQSLGMGLSAMVVDKIGEGLKEASAKALEMQERLFKGDANMADLANEVAKTIPLIGPFVEGFENIGELITHEKRDLAEVAEQIKLADEATRLQVENAQRMRDFIHETAIEAGRAADEIMKIQFPGSRDAAALADYQSRLADIAEEARKAHENLPNDKTVAGNSKEIALLQGEKERLQQQRVAKGTDNLSEEELRKRYTAAQGRSSGNFRDSDLALGFDLKVIEDQKDIARKIHDLSKNNADIGANIDKAAQQKRDEAAAVRDAHLKKDAEEREAAATAFNAKLRQIEVDGQKALAEAQGFGAQAAQSMLKVERDKALEEAKARHTKAVNETVAGSAERNQADDQFRREGLTIQENYDNKSQALSIQQGEDKHKAEFTAQQAILQMKAEAHAEFLRLQGQGGEAEIELIRRQGDKRIAEIREQADREAAAHQEIAPQIRAKADADIKAVTTDTDRQERQARESNRERDISTNEALVRGQIGALEQQAKSGDILAAQEAKRLKIQDEFNQKRAEYTRIIHDENSTAQQRAAAQGLLGSLDSQEKLALAGMNAFGVGREQAATISARGTGASSRQREEASIAQARELAKAREEAKRAAEKTNGLLEKIHAALTGEVSEPVLKGVR